MPHRGKYFCKVGNIKNTENKKELSDFSNRNQIALYSWIILKCCHFVVTGQFRNAKVQHFKAFQPFGDYSHSIVAGGLLVISYTIRLMWSTSLMIRLETFSNTS